MPDKSILAILALLVIALSLIFSKTDGSLLYAILTAIATLGGATINSHKNAPK